MAFCEDHAAGTSSKERALLAQSAEELFHDIDNVYIRPTCRAARERASFALTASLLA